MQGPSDRRPWSKLALAVFVCAALGIPAVATEGLAGRLPRAFANTNVSRKARAAIKSTVLRLPRSKSQCKDYDYFPTGGMRNFYCHIKDRLSYATIEKLSGLSVYASGPHKGGTLDLAAPKGFGYYNKTFVRWLAAAIPGLANAKLKRLLRPVYKASIRPLARIFYVTHRKLAGNRRYLAKEKKHYLSLVASGQTASYYEKFFYFMSPGFYARPNGNMRYFQQHGFDGGVNGNVTKTCTAFWIRRSIDGTDGAFFEGLKQLLKIYDAAFLRAAKRVKPNGNHKRLMKVR